MLLRKGNFFTKGLGLTMSDSVTTKTVKITGSKSDEKNLQYAAELIRQGKLVVFPTETVYGLGGNATDPTAAKKIYEAKGRPSDNPLIIHIAEPRDAELYAYTSPTYYKLAASFMPGPLTVILPKKDSVPASVTGGLHSVAIRCPSHSIAHSLIEKAGVAIAAPSANLSGRPSPTCAEHVIDDLLGRVDMIIDGGESEIGLESTIVKLDGEKAILLRPGGITFDALCCVLDDVTINPAVAEQLAANERPLSPGMKYKHYAPSAPLTLLSGDEKKVTEFLLAEQKAQRTAILCYDEEISLLKGDSNGELLIPIGNRDDLDAQARSLFAALRKADSLGAEKIYAHLPNMDGLGLALYNRMIRAAAHTVKNID